MNGRVYVILLKDNRLTGAKRREWMGMGVAGILINSYHGSFPHSLRLAPLKLTIIHHHQP